MTSGEAVDRVESQSCIASPAGVAPVELPQWLLDRRDQYMAADFPAFVLAQNVSDIEACRMSTGLRLGSLRRAGASDAETAVLDSIHTSLKALEMSVIKDLDRAMKTHPLAPWIKRSKGVGSKQAARLLASIGNPYWNNSADRPRRGPYELFAYCGFHVVPAVGLPGPDARNPDATAGLPLVAPRHRKGVRSNWSAEAHSRAYLVALACKMAVRGEKGEYRLLYEAGRTKYADAVHQADCKFCGRVCEACGFGPGATAAEHLEARGCSNRSPVPAAAGTPLLPAHQDARAMRLVSKRVLLDIWREARDWHLAAQP